MKRGIAAVAPFAVSLIVGGCSASAEAEPVKRGTMAHGIEIGQQVQPTSVRCGDGEQREVGTKDRIQIVTFATPYDCYTCSAHLGGLPESKVLRSSHVEAFVVVWAPQSKLATREFKKISEKYTVCVDERGALWDAHAISHTPVTVALRGGEVVYLNDQPLIQPEKLKQFESDLTPITRGTE